MPVSSLYNNSLGPKGGKHVADALKVNKSLTSLNVVSNGITGDGAENLAKVVLESASLTDFCGIPLVSLRENSVHELNLSYRGVGVPGAIVLSKLIPTATALTSLKCACNSNPS